MTRDAEHTTSPQSVVVPDPLWMMHVIGPDDIYPAPDHVTAVEWCAYLNREIAPKVPSVLCVAVPAIWTGTAEEHAEGLAEAISGWTVPAAPAPSSLAGGEVEAAIDHLTTRLNKPGAFHMGDEPRLRTILAALSPSSLAGGEVTNDDAPTYMRLAQSLSRHPEVMVVERSDPTLELTPDSLEHLLEDVFPLAALSPEAPARVGVVMAATDVPMWADGIVTDGENVAMAQKAEADHGGHYWAVDGGNGGLDWEPTHFISLNALTPRHEARASEDEARRKLIECIDQWDSEMEYDAEDRASLADDILHAFNGPPVSREAPAEGVGYVAADAEAALKAGMNRAIYPARTVHATLPLFTHPAAPSADKLRIAVEAMQGAIEWDKRTGYRMPYRVRDPLYAALDLSTPDALKGDAK